MCGLIGVIGAAIEPHRWQRACHLQRSRGPDEQREEHGLLAAVPFSLAHQRLAILDLTPTGSQPMVHPRSGAVLVFNGEIYNYVEIRKELEASGVRFLGTSDTEVLLHALEIWGIEGTLPRLNGAWAFAWIVPARGMAYLCRDRFGEKPLHYQVRSEGVIFASDMRAVADLAGQRFTIDRLSVARFLRLGVLELDERTLIQEISQVPAATYLPIAIESGRPRVLSPVRYWRCPVEPVANVSPCDFENRLRALVMDSMRIRLRSDVPVGILLSGGLDSSVMATTAAKLGIGNVLLLSLIDYEKPDGDPKHIEMMERYLGARVTRISLQGTGGDPFDQLRETVRRMGTPINSMAMVAHFMLMDRARQSGVKVVLSGQGADEALCGYRKFLGFATQELLRSGRVLEAAKLASGFALNATVLTQFSLPEGARYLPRMGRPDERLGEALSDISVENPRLLVNETLIERQVRDLTALSVPTLNQLEDRSSMANSCEVRLPFLDHRIIELSVPAPLSCKLCGGWTKVGLRRAYSSALPHEVTWRRDKQGFSNPEATLLKTVLRTRLENDYLDSKRNVFEMGLLNHNYAIQSLKRLTAPVSIRRPWVRDFVQMMTLEMWLEDHLEYLR